MRSYQGRQSGFRCRFSFKAATRAYRFSDNLTRIASLLAERGKMSAALRNPLNDVLGVGNVSSDVYDLLMPAMYAQRLTKRLDLQLSNRPYCWFLTGITLIS